MFKPGDLVQPCMGGPKLKVVETNDDQIVAVRVSSESGDEFTPKTASVMRYTEEGDFGIC